METIRNKMTIEKALSILDNMYKYYNDYAGYDGYEGFSKDDNEAFVMAYNALAQESCEDVISKQAMFNILVKYGIHESKIAEELEELPPVTPTAKIGHWIYKIYGGFHEQGNWYCSHCDYRYNYGNGHAKFCPECGLKMSEPSTEEAIRDKDYDWIIKR